MTTHALQRAQWLDLFKTMLVHGMILAHVIQLLGDRNALSRAAVAVSTVVNLLSFPGFLLAFGIGIGLAGLQRPRPLDQRLWPAVPVQAAVYVCSLGYIALVQRDPLTLEHLLDLLSLRVLFGYSEFLASFLVLYVGLAWLRPPLLQIANSPWMLSAAVCFCLTTSLLTLPAGIPLAATLLGSTSHPSFPLLPYLPWFLVGLSVGLGGGRLAPWHLVAALLASAAFLWGTMEASRLPTRFPPNAPWILGPGLLLIAYIVLAQRVCKEVNLPDWLLVAGRHPLLFLVGSNLVIFAARYTLGAPIRDLWMATAVTIAIIVTITLSQVAREAVTWLGRKRATSP